MRNISECQIHLGSYYSLEIENLQETGQTAVNNDGEICSKLENNNKKARNYLDSYVCLTF